MEYIIEHYNNVELISDNDHSNNNDKDAMKNY